MLIQCTNPPSPPQPPRPRGGSAGHGRSGGSYGHSGGGGGGEGVLAVPERYCWWWWQCRALLAGEAVLLLAGRHCWRGGCSSCTRSALVSDVSALKKKQAPS